jgi:hypothetical protein
MTELPLWVPVNWATAVAETGLPTPRDCRIVARSAAVCGVATRFAAGQQRQGERNDEDAA